MAKSRQAMALGYLGSYKKFTLSIPSSVSSGVFLDQTLQPKMIEDLKNAATLPEREKVLQQYLQYKLPSDSPKD
jgi:hypothetical protein